MEELIKELKKLPGIGSDGARRIIFYLMGKGAAEVDRLTALIKSTVVDYKICSECGNISRVDPCEICSNPLRDKSKLCIVEDVEALMNIETSGYYDGLYHVMMTHRQIFSTGEPDDEQQENLTRHINELKPSEIIIGTSPNVTGQLIYFAIMDAIKASDHKPGKITRFAYGLPAGIHVEHADKTSLHAAIDFRAPVEFYENAKISSARI
ncbi:MAG: recombination protein RecR [Synergistaceae bacterium]|nr:recombination protein RecR [Synergistaceae bacterium]